MTASRRSSPGGWARPLTSTASASSTPATWATSASTTSSLWPRGCIPGPAAAVPESLRELAALPGEKRSPAQAYKLRAYFLDHDASAALREAHDRLLGLRKERQRLVEGLPTTMVMEELPTPRDTFILNRGQ